MALIKKIFPVAAIITALLITSGCQKIEKLPLTGKAWQRSDLRTLELPNQANPDLDVIAAYARRTDADIEIRFDLLGSPDPYSYDLTLYLDSQPGGTRLPGWIESVAFEWDIAVQLPARGMPQTARSDGSQAAIRPRSLRLDVQDAIIIRLAESELTRNYSVNLADLRISASIREVDLPGPADTIGPFHFLGPPVEQQAPLLLSFWDALPSVTPAQALRRWNGAHTGPYGQRHGLSILLQNALRGQVPVAVLDLKHSDRLSALELLGGLDLIHEMQKKSLLLIPDLAYGDPMAASESIRLSSTAGKEYQIAVSSFLYGSVQPDIPTSYQAVFAHTGDSTHLSMQNSQRLIPLPDGQSFDSQVDQQGLNTAVRVALLKAALSEDPGDLVVLGGSLPSSAWGDSLIAAPSFEYIAGHPWILPLNEQALLDMPAVQGQPACSDLLCVSVTDTAQRASLRDLLGQLQDGLFKDLSWQTYRKLTQPVGDPRLQTLREEYLSQVYLLAYAAEWEGNRIPVSGCSEDLDRDGNPECILASEHGLLILEPEGGRLVLAAGRVDGKIFQAVGQRSQLVTGLGDPFEWRPGSGFAADPQEIPGAFGSLDDLQTYMFEIDSDQVTFQHPEKRTRKVFHLTETGFIVDIDPGQPGEFQLPLILLTPSTWKPGSLSTFQAVAGNTTQEWIWEGSDEKSLRIYAQGGKSSLTSFSESLTRLALAEDPNAEYSSGWYLPFPMAAIHFETDSKIIVEVNFQAQER